MIRRHKSGPRLARVRRNRLARQHRRSARRRSRCIDRARLRRLTLEESGSIGPIAWAKFKPQVGAVFGLVVMVHTDQLGANRRRRSA